MKIKTYVINLEDSVERREAVLAELAKYSFMDVELIEAVDGRKMKAEEIEKCFDVNKFIDTYSRTPRRGEIGCTLSHRICYRKLLESDEEFALILEDDVMFLYPEDMETIINDILNAHKDKKACFITLAFYFLYYTKKYRKLGKYTLYKIYNAYGTCAYLTNRKAAKRLLSVPFPFTLADDYPFLRKCGIRVEGIYPTLALDATTQEIIPTEIQQESVKVIHTKVSLYQRIIFDYRTFYYRILIKLGRLASRSYNEVLMNKIKK